MSTRAEIVFETKRRRGEYGQISVGWVGYLEGVGRLAEFLVGREPSVRLDSDLPGVMEEAVEHIRAWMRHSAGDSVYIIDEDSRRHLVLDYVYYVGYQRRRLWIECEGKPPWYRERCCTGQEVPEMFPVSSGAG